MIQTGRRTRNYRRCFKPCVRPSEPFPSLWVRSQLPSISLFGFVTRSFSTGRFILTASLVTGKTPEGSCLFRLFVVNHRLLVRLRGSACLRPSHAPRAAGLHRGRLGIVDRAVRLLSSIFSFAKSAGSLAQPKQEIGRNGLPSPALLRKMNRNMGGREKTSY
jgi:hypothetical protein